MTTKKLHIVSFDVPFPADYGGVIDVFYRIKALHSLGYKITLHCFEYGRGEQAELEKYTEQVHYYKRNKKLNYGLSRTPFIVKSRNSEQLLENLLLDNAPILFEGLHTTSFLGNDHLKTRLKLVRTHNIEHEYYGGLAKKSVGFKKFYFTHEARKLQKYEGVLKHANHILAIQEKDFDHFSKIHSSVHLLPAAIPMLEEMIYSKTLSYSVFHGNLSVAENETAALWIIDAVESTDAHPLIISGKNPSDKLVKRCAEKNVTLIPNPDANEMSALINNARVHVLYTDQATGLKLKLLNALQTSGHVVVNNAMIEGTQLGSFCTIANTKEEFRESVQAKLTESLSEEEFEARKKFLEDNYSTAKNCGVISNLLGD